MYPNLLYADGLQAVIALSVYNYNNGLTYMTYTGNPAAGVAQTDLRNSDAQLIGSVSYIDGRKGTLNLQYALASDELANSVNECKPGHIVSFRNRFYVCGAVTPSVAKNNVIKFSVAVTELQAPFVPILLSTLGQQLKATGTASSPITVNCVASNTRPGATVTYTLETFGTPLSAAPSGFTIVSGTGVMTVNAVAATYDVRVVVKDVITNADGTTDTVYGFGRYTVTLS